MKRRGSRNAGKQRIRIQREEWMEGWKNQKRGDRRHELREREKERVSEGRIPWSRWADRRERESVENIVSLAGCFSVSVCVGVTALCGTVNEPHWKGIIIHGPSPYIHTFIHSFIQFIGNESKAAFALQTPLGLDPPPLLHTRSDYEF